MNLIILYLVQKTYLCTLTSFTAKAYIIYHPNTPTELVLHNLIQINIEVT